MRAVSRWRIALMAIVLTGERPPACAEPVDTANRAATTAELSDPVVVAVSPPHESRWGFYQFPDLWRGRDGALYLAMHVGADSATGEHEPTKYFASPDDGRTWSPSEENETDRSPAVIPLADGSQVAFGESRFLYHVPAFAGAKVSASQLKLRSAFGPILDGWGVNEYHYYRFGDLPVSVRRFPVAVRTSPSAKWTKSSGDLVMPDLLLPALARAAWPDRSNKLVWEEQPHSLTLPAPVNEEHVVALEDGRLLWAVASQNPGVRDRRCSRVDCLLSEDRGKTWHPQGVIANDANRTTWGYSFGEHALAQMPNGDLLCVMRTIVSTNPGHTHYLAAARSSDRGVTWSAPKAMAPFSVTPHLIALKNGVVAVVYGRPGVHVRLSRDSGFTWSEPAAVVGTPETELLSQPKEQWWRQLNAFSCANTSVVVHGADRFLIAYSDFQYQDAHGQRRKANLVREVVAKP